MEPVSIVLLLLLGGATGVLAGLLGIGGGMIMVPFVKAFLLSRGFALDQAVKIAVATSLATILFTSVSSVLAHDRRGSVTWPVVLALAPGLAIGSLVVAQLAGWMSGRVLAGFFAAFVGYSATTMLFKRQAPAGSLDRPAPATTLPGPSRLFAVGTGIGGLAALVGAGGAFLTVPFLNRHGMKMSQAVGTSAACGFPIAVAGMLGYMWAGRELSLGAGTVGFIHVPALLCIASASVLTAPLGARLAHRIPTEQLRRTFAVILYALAAYMLWTAIRG